MRCEVFDHADVCDTCGKWTLAAGADLENLTQETLFELLAHGAKSRIEPFDMADSAHKTGGFERFDQLGGLDMRGCDRLFDECVDSGCG